MKGEMKMNMAKEKVKSRSLEEVKVKGEPIVYKKGKSEEERQVRLEVKKMIGKESGLRDISPEENFRRHANQLNYLDKIRASMFNQWRAFVEKKYLMKDLKAYESIVELSKRENEGTEKQQKATKKKVQEMKKKALAKITGLSEEKALQKIYDEAEHEFKMDVACRAFEVAENTVLLPELKKYVETMPIYSNWLIHIKGIGDKSAIKLISYIKDIRRFPRPSNLCSYLGYGDPSKQKKKVGEKASWNHKARAFLFVVSENMVKKESEYRKIYDERKERTKEKHPEWHNLNPDGTKNKGQNMHPQHADKDAKRVMIKRFLQDLFEVWYRSLGLEPPCKPFVLEHDKVKHREQPPIVPYPAVKDGNGRGKSKKGRGL